MFVSKKAYLEWVPTTISGNAEKERNRVWVVVSLGMRLKTSFHVLKSGSKKATWTWILRTADVPHDQLNGERRVVDVEISSPPSEKSIRQSKQGYYTEKG